MAARETHRGPVPRTRAARAGGGELGMEEAGAVVQGGVAARVCDFGVRVVVVIITEGVLCACGSYGLTGCRRGW